MKVRRTLFVAILVASIVAPGSFGRAPAGASGPGVILSPAAAGDAERGITKSHSRRSSPGTRGIESVGSHLTPEEIRELLASHNSARARVGLAPLVWSDRLAAYADEWAHHLAFTSGLVEHRPNTGRWKQVHGENIFMGTAGYYGVKDAVAMWERERSAYDGGTIEMSRVHGYGHYTQLVWRTTKRVGCAKVNCAGNLLVVCNYDPPGNVLGKRAY